MMINLQRVNSRLIHFIGLARAQNIDLETFIEKEREDRLRRLQERPLTPPPVFTDEILHRWFNSETEQVSLLIHPFDREIQRKDAPATGAARNGKKF